MTLHATSALVPRDLREEATLTPTHSFMLAVMRSIDFIVGIPLHARERILIADATTEPTTKSSDSQAAK
ncbi:hypothetical protein JCM24511_09772 [Saitozyma sp. JCM 24511]|nr:hypothetical protein JCM24511_09772 [Saitozyma sp. JCM 24511]